MNMCASAAVLIAASIFFRAHSCIVVPPPPPPVRPQPEYLDVRSQHVTISFEHPVVRTRVETTLYNPHDHAVEGTFLFPIPANASVTKFQFFVDGRAVSGEILPAEKARDAYLEIVRGLRDPALLEYSDMGLFRARLFPVEPHKTSKIAVECLQTLAVSDNLVRYFHNIRLGRTDTPQTGELIIDGRIHSQVPVKSVFSPTHDLEIVRQDDHNVRFSLELNERPYDRDFLLYYGVADAPVGFHSLVHRSAGEDGYFLLLLAPAIPAQEQIPAKDVVLVIDTSGSMRGDKINQARRALLYALKTLKPGDRFGIIAFATAPRPLDDELLPATAENVERASKWIEELEAAGGTDIHGALIEACKIASIGRNDGRPSYILMATDGQPTYGVRDTGKIVSEVTEANRGQGSARSRLFVLGIGYDVNAHLLDLLAERNGGTTGYVRPEEDIEIAISALVDKIGSPVLTDLSLTVTGPGIADVHPARPRDLFKGEQLAVVGRYTSPGQAKVSLKGRLGASPQVWEWQVDLPGREPSNDFLPRVWATRHIGHLLDEIRLRGENEELKQEIVRLALKFGIVTPYTSYLVAEEQPRIAETTMPGWRAAAGSGAGTGAFAAPGQVRREAGDALAGLPAGKPAVQAAQDLARMKEATAAPPPAAPTVGSQPQAVRYVGGKTFYYDAASGYWIDSDYREDLGQLFVRYLGNVYTELLRRRPDIARWLAVGEKVKVCVGTIGLVVAPDAQDTLSQDQIGRL